MAEHSNTKNRHSRKKEENNKGIKLFVAGLVLVFAAAAIVIFASRCHEGTREKIQNLSYPQSYSDYVEASAKKYGLDPALVYAVIRTESNFDPTAGSAAGAHGLMQITTDTFDHYRMLRGEEDIYAPEDIYDPAVNIDYGCNILHDHLATYGDEECAVAAYNAGPGNVDSWLNDPNISPDGKTLITENIPFAETRSYVVSVEDAKQMYKKLYYS